jgi:natural product precursor
MKIKRFKLNKMSGERLHQKEMNAIIGGDTCGCGCLFQGKPGGSSTADNKNANYKNGYFSAYSYYVCDDYGSWRYENPPMPIYTD